MSTWSSATVPTLEFDYLCLLHQLSFQSRRRLILFLALLQSYVFSTVVLINEYEGVNERLFRAGLYDGPTAPQLIGDDGDEQGVTQDFG